ncbi:MAG: polyprenyl synthetase family protein [Candidatus Kapaibacteriales bacterium]
MEEFREKLEKYLTNIEAKLLEFVPSYPNNLYGPVAYVMEKGGKRLRPILTLVACEMYGGTFEDALNAAFAIEYLHNFTLVHDDIMDNSNFRHGKPTIHNKWDLSTAILSGDVLAGLGFKALQAYSNSTNFGAIFNRYVDAFIKVCEGQALDILFNSKNDVNEDEYFEMISKKTANLIQASLVIGALCASALEKDITYLEKFGRNLGIAFQIQDDLLDLTADQSKLGKMVGLDLIEKKKTLLVIKAKKLATTKKDRDLISKIFSEEKVSADEIKDFDHLFRKLNVYKYVQKDIDFYVQQSLALINNFPNNNARKVLEFIVNQINVRSH